MTSSPRTRKASPPARTDSLRKAAPATQQPIRVVLIEDNRLARDRIAGLLDGQSHLKVVAIAACATTGLARVLETRPHVVIVDAGLANTEVHRFLTSLKSMAPETRVVLTDMRPTLDDVIAFIKAGASGIILKDATMGEFARTIRSVAEGTDVVPASLSSMLMSYIAGRAIVRVPPEVQPAGVTTTKREREITGLIAEGLANKEIAQRLNIGVHTVKTHVHHILEKLSLHTRLQIAAHTRQAVPLIRSLDLDQSKVMLKTG